jgi:hypothetical protein
VFCGGSGAARAALRGRAARGGWSGGGAQSGRLEEALERLGELEKRARHLADAVSGARVCVAMAECCIRARAWSTLSDQLQILSKKRGQSQKASQELVRACMHALDGMEDRGAEERLIGTLRSVTEGKLFVEVEYARLTLRLAHMQERDGKVDDASRTLQEIAVETVGSMQTGEKVDLLLEQLRLTRLQRDFVRMGIIANKVGRRIIDRRGMAKRRVAFLHELIALHTHRRDAVALSEDYERLYDTLVNPTAAATALESREQAAKTATGNASIARTKGSGSGGGAGGEADEGKEAEADGGAAAAAAAAAAVEAGNWILGTRPSMDGDGVRASPAELNDTLSHVALFACLAKHDEEADVRLQRLRREARLERESPVFHSMVLAVTTQEITPWPLPAQVRDDLLRHPVLHGARDSDARSSVADSDSTVAAALAVADTSADPTPSYWWGLLRKRIVEHNVRVVAGYYERARSARIATMLGLSEDELEHTVSELVCAKTIWARIDRPAGVIQFARPKPPAQVLSAWSADISKLLGLVERTAHVIQKEKMTHAAAAAAAGAAGAGGGGGAADDAGGNE